MNVTSLYTGKIRVRVAGIFEDQNEVLLVKLRSPISNQDIWLPPGGGVEFGETLKEALFREFAEETSLKISVHELLHVNEIIERDFHILEHFFRVEKIEGTPKLGSDPEHSKDEQLLLDLGFFNEHNISEIDCKPDYLKEKYWIDRSS